MVKKANRSIVLVGMMGSGKSLVGEKLSAALNLPFADSDNIIEEEVNARISDIFTYQGEEYFRKKEAEVIANLLQGEAIVLSCGGGAFCNEKTRKLCKTLGISIYLKTPAKTLWNRVENKNHRPLAKDGFDRFNALLESRKADYEQADIIIDCQGKNENDITNQITCLLSENNVI